MNEKIGLDAETKDLLIRQLKSMQTFLENTYDMRCDRGVGEKFEDLICKLEDE